jgi:hypothetical protein
MITEWNLDAVADSRYADSLFIQEWTTEALREWGRLTAVGVYAAFNYTGESHSDFQLIDSKNNVTPQGVAFFRVPPAPAAHTLRTHARWPRSDRPVTKSVAGHNPATVHPD